MTVTEASRKLNVTERHIRRLIQEGVIAADRNGKSWHITQLPKDFCKGALRKERRRDPRKVREAKVGITRTSLIAREMAHWAERFFDGASDIQWIGQSFRDGVWRVRNRAVPRDKWLELHDMAERFVRESGRMRPEDSDQDVSVRTSSL